MFKQHSLQMFAFSLYLLIKLGESTTSMTRERLREIEAENARLKAGTTSATREALKKAEAENSRLKEDGKG